MTTVSTDVIRFFAPPGSGLESKATLYITVSGITAEEAAEKYRFSPKQMALLDELLCEREGLHGLLDDLNGEMIEAKKVIKALPEDPDPIRREVVETACSLVGKVNYFWGGKSPVIGWDARWGTLQLVSADGSGTTGTYQLYGLDCSGFVDWVFYQVSEGAYTIAHGAGTYGQHHYSRNTTWDAALPGDLVFYPADAHVGIVGGRDEDGNLIIIHCGGTASNVVITGAESFSSVAVPEYYG